MRRFFGRLLPLLYPIPVCVVCRALIWGVSSEEIGNVQMDALSSQKYYHFIRLMGRAASNIALECALQTRPNVCLISEEVQAKSMSLKQVGLTLGSKSKFYNTLLAECQSRGTSGAEDSWRW